jgi:hypothetical protein
VIVITGVGRSGTSFLARLYRELGFDPGGRWLPALNAGYEDDEVVEANERVAHDLGLRFLGGPGPQPTGRWAQTIGRMRRMGRGRSLDRFDTIRPDSVAPTAERHGDRLREVASSHVVVKDPRFCWTLAVWLHAGAAIDHVVLSTRSMDAVIASRRAAGHLRYRTEAAAAKELTHALGLCFSAIAEHELAHTVVRFPHVLDRPEELAASLPFPHPLDAAVVIAAVRTAGRRDLVHDWR